MNPRKRRRRGEIPILFSADRTCCPCPIGVGPCCEYTDRKACTSPPASNVNGGMPAFLNGEWKLTGCLPSLTWDFVFALSSVLPAPDCSFIYLSPVYDCGFDGGSRYQIMLRFNCDGSGSSVASYGVRNIDASSGFTLCPSGLPGTTVTAFALCPKVSVAFLGDCGNSWDVNCWCASNPTVPASFDLACDCAQATLTAVEP